MLEIAVLVFVVGGFVGMIWAALVCLKKKSRKAGITAVAIILIQGAVMQPWRSREPFNTSDADEVTDLRQARQITIAWMGFSAVSFALVMLALVKKRKESSTKRQSRRPQAAVARLERLGKK